MTQCDADRLVQRFGTPLLVIDEDRLRSIIGRFREAFQHPDWRCQVVYAAKALALKSVARIMHEEGLGLDVCSEGELQTAVQAGVPARQCILHGCAKTKTELELAIRLGVGHVVVDNQAEIELLGRLTVAAGSRSRVLVRLNVGVSAATKPQVQTGALDSKFGFPVGDGQALLAVAAVHASPALDFAGIHCHIGSQIVALDSYAREIEQLAAFATRIMHDRHIPCGVINVGGGLGSSENDVAGDAPSPQAWAGAIFGALQERFTDVQLPRPEIMVEPGRSIIAPAGTTLYTIAVRKVLGTGERALIVDGGMSDNPRPALYKAEYPVTLASRKPEPADGTYTIFGRHCETDLLFRDVPLADPQPGDILAVHNTGAYTYSMASNYNRFPRPAVVLSSGTGARLIARRESLERLLDLDVLDEPTSLRAR